MYFTLALLLLVSPAFGRPSSPVLNAGVEVVNELDSFVEFSQEAGKTLNNSKLFEKVSEAMNEADQTVIEMELHLISLQEQVPQLRNGANFFPKFNEAKQILRETRQELRKLATKTVIEVRDLKDLLEGVDKGEDEDNILLKTSIDKMKNFMIETLERLDNAREKYQSALETFDNLNSSIETQTEVLNKVLKADTADFRKDEKYNEKIEGICRWANIFTFGLCGIINYHVNTIPLGEAEEALEQLTTLSKNMLEKGRKLTDDIDEAIVILTDEIELINEWANSAENVKRNIDKYPQKYLRKYISIRTIFINGLDDLSNVAEKFLAQPPTIW